MNNSAWRLSVAPMIDVTDKHCRYFHRLLAPKARLYTEMISTGAIKHGDQARHLDFNEIEHPLAIQLGGNDTADLAASAKVAEQWGYDEVNLNCGCPSDRVQSGAFGACLMASPDLVADCYKAMQDAVSVPVTIKHRLGLDYNDSYGFVRDFVGTIYAAGCRVFIAHARNAVLKGLSPKENRNIPPLRYDYVANLKRDFPDAIIVINGGLNQQQQCLEQLQLLDGLMLGRVAWHNPGFLAQIHKCIYPEIKLASTAEVYSKYFKYMQQQYAQGVPLHILLRPLLGWHTGLPGARKWRRMLSDNKQLKTQGLKLVEQAWLELGLA